jgi:predicted O-methyltransferase YrrM
VSALAISGDHVSIDGWNFVIDMPRDGRRSKSTEEALVLVKNKAYLDVYEELRSSQPLSIFEVGFFEGGSSVLFDLLFKPSSLTCVDIRTSEIEAVSQYIRKAGREAAMRMVYGVDQADTKTLRRLVSLHHDGSLDLIIDDASHRYELSKATFNALFPFLRPGGHYIIEDYGWAHSVQFQAPDHSWQPFTSLSNLLTEITMAISAPQSLVSRLDVRKGVAIVTRSAVAAPTDFDISSSYLNRGRPFVLNR